MPKTKFQADLLVNLMLLTKIQPKSSLFILFFFIIFPFSIDCLSAKIENLWNKKKVSKLTFKSSFICMHKKSFILFININLHWIKMKKRNTFRLEGSLLEIQQLRQFTCLSKSTQIPSEWWRNDAENKLRVRSTSLLYPLYNHRSIVDSRWKKTIRYCIVMIFIWLKVLAKWKLYHNFSGCWFGWFGWFERNEMK